MNENDDGHGSTRQSSLRNFREEYEKSLLSSFSPFQQEDSRFFPIPEEKSLLFLTNGQCIVVKSSDGSITQKLPFFPSEMLGSTENQPTVTASVMCAKVYSSSPFKKKGHSEQAGPVSLFSVATSEGNIRIYTLLSGTCSMAREWIGSKRTIIREMRFSPDGKYLVSCCADGSAKVWDILSNAISSMPPRPGRLTSVDFIDIPTNESTKVRSYMLAFGTESGEIIFWDPVLHKSHHVMNLSSQRIIAVSYMSSTKSILVASADQMIFCIKHAQNTEGSESFKVHDKFLVKEPISEVSFIEKSSCPTPEVHTIDDLPVVIEGGEVKESTYAVIAFTSGMVTCYDISDVVSNKSIANPKVVKKSGSRTPEEMGKHPIFKIQYAAFEDLVWCSTGDNLLYCLEFPTMKIRRTLLGGLDSVLSIRGLHVQDDKQALIIGNNSPTPLIVFPGSNACIGQLVGHSDTVICISTAFGGRLIATGAKDHTIHLWYCDAGKGALSESIQCLATAECADEVNGIAFMRSGNEVALVSTSTDDTLSVWKIQSEKLKKRKEPLDISDEKRFLRRLTGGPVTLVKSVNHTISGLHNKAKKTSAAQRAGGNVFSVAASTGEYIATGGRDKSICIYSWTAENGVTHETTLTGHRKSVYCLAFHPTDKGILASGSGDCAVKLWSLYTGGCQQTLQGHTSAVLSIDFISEGLQAVSGDANGSVRVWRADSGVCVNVLQASTEEKIWALHAIGAGDTLFLGGAEGTLECWEDVTAERCLKRSKARVEKQEKTAQLEVCLHSRNYAEGICRALELRHPRFVYRFLRLYLADASRMPEGPSESRPTEHGKGLRELLSSLEDESVVALIGYCIDWLRIANRSGVAQSCLYAVLRTRSPEFLLKVDPARCGVTAGSNVIEVMLQRTAKYAGRVKKVLLESYAMEYLEFLNSGNTGSLLAFEDFIGA
ncbi:hypothetical protein XU18_1840 [Perkinsela sp. CCAP 1560/4]|nr:hypothetical protein XU18_1840 [Perkinsela sp. CCAP 1560/4]|eukprot:KNH07308.1 hypothetical protein XU18_1840 [Perkinsela sp. CCAP 1560/4]